MATPRTLYEYYAQRGMRLPTVQQRRQTFGGLEPNYTGTAPQNQVLLARLLGGDLGLQKGVSNQTGTSANTSGNFNYNTGTTPNGEPNTGRVAELPSSGVGKAVGKAGEWVWDAYKKAYGPIISGIKDAFELSPTSSPQATASAGGAVSTPNFVNGTPDWVKPLITKAAEQYKIPTVVLSALLKQESGFNPQAKSHVGAMGIAQFMPATARQFGINAWNPQEAIPAAAKYIKAELDRFGRLDYALAAYNAGAGAVKQFGGVPPYKETKNYVKNIMAMVDEPHRSYNSASSDIVYGTQKNQNTSQPRQSQEPNQSRPRPAPQSVDETAPVKREIQTPAPENTTPITTTAQGIIPSPDMAFRRLMPRGRKYARGGYA